MANDLKIQARLTYWGGLVACGLVRQAADEAKSLDPKKIAAVMHSGRTFKTVIGFDGKGDVQSPACAMYVWKKNESGRITYSEIE